MMCFARRGRSCLIRIAFDAVGETYCSNLLQLSRSTVCGPYSRSVQSGTRGALGTAKGSSTRIGGIDLQELLLRMFAASRWLSASDGEGDQSVESRRPTRQRLCGILAKSRFGRSWSTPLT
jgi:hypothetical protein